MVTKIESAKIGGVHKYRIKAMTELGPYFTNWEDTICKAKKSFNESKLEWSNSDIEGIREWAKERNYKVTMAQMVFLQNGCKL